MVDDLIKNLIKYLSLRIGLKWLREKLFKLRILSMCFCFLKFFDKKE